MKKLKIYKSQNMEGEEQEYVNAASIWRPRGFGGVQPGKFGYRDPNPKEFMEMVSLLTFKGFHEKYPNCNFENYSDYVRVNSENRAERIIKGQQASYVKIMEEERLQTLKKMERRRTMPGAYDLLESLMVRQTASIAEDTHRGISIAAHVDTIVTFEERKPPIPRFNPVYNITEFGVNPEVDELNAEKLAEMQAPYIRVIRTYHYDPPMTLTMSQLIALSNPEFKYVNIDVVDNNFGLTIFGGEGKLAYLTDTLNRFSELYPPDAELAFYASSVQIEHADYRNLLIGGIIKI